MMARRGRQRKPQNGRGDSFKLSVTFDPALEDDKRAYAVWQYLADQRKGTDVIKSVLHFIADHEERTGVILTPERIMALFMGGQGLATSGPPLDPGQPVERERADIIVNTADSQTNAEEIARRFLESSAGLDIFGEGL